MIINLKQQPDIQKKETSFTKIPATKMGSAVAVCNEENINNFQQNKKMSGVYEQLPHHCVQLYFLS